MLGVIFALIMMYFTYNYYKRKNYSRRAFLTWMGIWVIVIIGVIAPQWTYSIADILQLERTADLYTTIAILFLTTMMFYTYNMVKKNDKRVEKLVRRLALKEQQQRQEAHKGAKHDEARTPSP